MLIHKYEKEGITIKITESYKKEGNNSELYRSSKTFI
jgi:hypothetical protein